MSSVGIKAVSGSLLSSVTAEGHHRDLYSPRHTELLCVSTPVIKAGAPDGSVGVVCGMALHFRLKCSSYLGTQCFAVMSAGVPLCGENMHSSQVQKVVSSFVFLLLWRLRQ